MSSEKSDDYIPVRIMAPRHMAPMLSALMELLTSDRCAHAVLDRNLVVQVTQLDGAEPPGEGGPGTFSFFTFCGTARDPVTALRVMIQLMAHHREAVDLETSRQVSQVAEQAGEPWGEWLNELYEQAVTRLAQRDFQEGCPPHGLPPSHMGVLWELRERTLDREDLPQPPPHRPGV